MPEFGQHVIAIGHRRYAIACVLEVLLNMTRDFGRVFHKKNMLIGHGYSRQIAFWLVWTGRFFLTSGCKRFA